ncbi:hypothetical protein ACKUVQ_08040 [Mycobacterium seoulense]|uniref:hypothetical protein n=1 Tax=Mycobacterium seoulense TaxID=386911 RepID=UPI003CEC2A1F
MTGEQLSSEAHAFAAASRTGLTALPDLLHGRPRTEEPGSSTARERGDYVWIMRKANSGIHEAY